VQTRRVIGLTHIFVYEWINNKAIYCADKSVSYNDNLTKGLLGNSRVHVGSIKVFKLINNESNVIKFINKFNGRYLIQQSTGWYGVFDDERNAIFSFRSTYMWDIN
jgi:regulatory protein YycI of two-component signal transduction system YycFG